MTRKGDPANDRFVEKMYAYVKLSLVWDRPSTRKRPKVFNASTVRRQEVVQKEQQELQPEKEERDDVRVALSCRSTKPPENELQKVGVASGVAGGERVMSEHQLRVQRSLQRLDVPDWYRNSQLPAQGFLLKRNSDAGVPCSTSTGQQHWPGLNSKTTSLSSLGSTQSAAIRSPTSTLQSPSPTPLMFSRWSTSRLNSGANSTSSSPSGSARSSFNYRQPYLGWRSQERLARPRTPAERLAAGILPHKQAQNVPNLNEVRSSIKEVTSAIVHYVAGSHVGDSTDRLSPALRWQRDSSSSRSASPRGSTGRLCWLESSFVGSRPLDVPETPLGLATTQPPQPHTSHTGVTELYLDLSPQPHRPNNNPVNVRKTSFNNDGQSDYEDNASESNISVSLIKLSPSETTPTFSLD